MSVDSPSSANEKPMERLEARRRSMAELLKLDPETANWNDILEADRVLETKKLGLPENATWAEIRQAHAENVDKNNSINGL